MCFLQYFENLTLFSPGHKISAEKAAIRQTGISLYIIWFFSLAALGIFSLSFTFASLILRCLDNGRHSLRGTSGSMPQLAVMQTDTQVCPSVAHISVWCQSSFTASCVFTCLVIAVLPEVWGAGGGGSPLAGKGDTYLDFV